MTDFTVRTRRLALSYLAIIMTLSLLFSAILYGVMSAQLDRPLSPRQQLGSEVTDWFRERIAERDREARGSMLLSLVTLNLVMLGGGALLSYYLAQRTLQPIREAMEAQEQFVSDASHELRTPLTALLTTNEVALRKKQLSQEKARDVLTRNIHEVEKLRGLTEMLLTLNRAEHAPLALESVQLGELVGDVVGSMDELAAPRSITIETTKLEDAAVSAEPLALAQVVKILLDNAIKYSPDASTIKLFTTQNDGSVVLHVKDRGIGIAPTDIERIFDRFYRADAARTRSDTSGHGLGLAIARTLASQQAHTLTVKSKPGKGAEFMLTMPTATGAVPARNDVS